MLLLPCVNRCSKTLGTACQSTPPIDMSCTVPMQSIEMPSASASVCYTTTRHSWPTGTNPVPMPPAQPPLHNCCVAVLLCRQAEQSSSIACAEGSTASAAAWFDNNPKPIYGLEGLGFHPGPQPHNQPARLICATMIQWWSPVANQNHWAVLVKE